jgi:hypothetical protein
VIDPNTLAREHGPYHGPYWVHIPDDTKGQIEMALVWACKFGRADVARYLLELGVDAASKDNDSMTALHWASARGLIDIIEILLAKGAPLEVRNTWGGTVVDSTAWFASNYPMPDADYPRVIEKLLEAGADAREIYPPLTGASARRCGTSSGTESELRLLDYQTGETHSPRRSRRTRRQSGPFVTFVCFVVKWFFRG